MSNFVGTQKNQVPANLDLGDFAFMDSSSVPSINAKTVSAEKILIDSNSTNIYPSFNQNYCSPDCAKYGILDSRQTFVRASNAYYWTSNNGYPYLSLVAPNIPRIEVDPETGEYLGLLMEADSTNIQLQSDSGWGGAVTAGNSTDAFQTELPTATTSTCIKFIPDSTTGTHYLATAPVASATTGTVYTFSVFVKPDGLTQLVLHNYANNNGYVLFDLTGSGSYSGLTGASSCGIKNVGRGWYRVWITWTHLATGNLSFYLSPTPNGSYSFTGDNFSAMWFWGAQWEAGYSMTSYIQTTTAAATRVADTMNISSSTFFNTKEGTCVLEFTQGYDFVNTNYLIGSGNSRVLYVNGTEIRSYDGTNIARQSDARSVIGGSVIKAAMSFNEYSANMQLSLNGMTATSLPFTNFSSLASSIPAGGLRYNGHFKSLAFYKHQVSSSELQELSR